MTDRCNFRCNYCMPADIFDHDYLFLNRREILSFEEICRVVRVCVGLGVTKIRLTGGEPLLRKELEVLVEMLAGIPGVEDLALTTNGYLLKQLAGKLKLAGLKRVTVSLDSLNPDTLKAHAGPHLELERILEGIEAAKKAGFDPIKINAVIQRDVNDHEILDLANYARTHGHIIRFIEYMDVGTLNGWKMNQVVPAKEIVQTIASAMPIEPIEKDYKSEVANKYRFLDGGGEFGIIASVTQPFCRDCTRIRLSAEGKLYTCLFASEGCDLKQALRTGASDEDLYNSISSIWQKRTDRYSELRTSETEPHPDKKIEMYQIGG